MKDVFCSYYTKNKNLTTYMISKIKPKIGDKILEPCGGDGEFIDSLLEYCPELDIDTCDLDNIAVAAMQSKYFSQKISIRQADTLTDSLFDKYCETGYYNKIIGNPPYGGWQEYEKRLELKKNIMAFM